MQTSTACQYNYQIKYAQKQVTAELDQHNFFPDDKKKVSLLFNNFVCWQGSFKMREYTYKDPIQFPFTVELIERVFKKKFRSKSGCKLQARYNGCNSESSLFINVTTNHITAVRYG